MTHRIQRIVCLTVILTISCVMAQGCSVDSGVDTSSSIISSTTASDSATTTPTSTITTTTASTTTATTSTATTAKPTTTTKSKNTTTSMPRSDVLQVPILAQFPHYPTGCESISAVMALKYYGESIDTDDFINNHLPKSEQFITKNGVLYGPDPNQYFVGHPTKTSSYGCMAPVIEAALISFFGSDERVKNTTGKSLTYLCKNYIDQGEPVLVWTTIGMIETYDGPSWRLEDGSTYYWPVNEHCMVLIGYDDRYYYFNDPYRGTMKFYSKWLCEARFNDLGMQSIAITK